MRAVLAVPLVNCVDKKKPRDEIIGNSSHRMAIFSLSVVISFLLFCLLLKIENSLWRASYYNCLFKFPIEFNQIIEIIAPTRVRTGVIFITCLSSFTFKKILLEGKMVSFINLTHVDTPYHRWTLFNVSCWLFIAFHALLARFFTAICSDEK